MEEPDLVVPSLETVQQLLKSRVAGRDGKQANLVPVYGQISSDLITPSAAYLKVSAHYHAKAQASQPEQPEQLSFLYESAATERVGRYSFVAAAPRKVLRTGPGFGVEADPLPALEEELARYTVAADVPGLQLPPLAGGAIGYVGYDCVRYFEPKTARPMRDVLQIPESLFMFFDTIVAFDRFFGVIKDRAEHVMLVDLARNDVTRVCDPLETRVDRLMTVEKFSHVQHLTSQVSGVLRPGKTRFDAFRSIFPAGTVSGAPKVRAMELIAELEGEKRGVYAGAVGYFGYGGLDSHGVEVEGEMDTCIALRTMLVKDGVAYLQAGGGIVFDSDEYDEWMETMNKLGANMQCITSAEKLYAK
ncbi:hypothetical protein RB595_004609 [Gaeumannomyces hyphopodioides]